MKNKNLKKSTGFLLIFALVFALVPVFFSLPANAVGDSFSSVCCGGNHMAYIKSDGSLWLWGWNDCGQIGDGSTYFKKFPVKVMDDAVQVSTGDLHTLAIKSDGSLWAWGDNKAGQLGDGTELRRTYPVKIMDDVTQVAAGKSYSLAIKSDGSLWAWGINTTGQLGNGTKIMTSNPVKILDDVIKISTGGWHALAIKSDGSLWAWGSNRYGQLGNNTRIQQLRPVKVADDFVQVSAGEWHNSGIKADGSLWTWGYNGIGQLGINNRVNKYLPVKIMDNIVQTSCGGSHTVAIDSEGYVWTWGRNADGQLGNGKFIDQFFPEKVRNTKGTIFVSAGYVTTLSVKSDGGLMSWGYKEFDHTNFNQFAQKLMHTRIADNVIVFPKSLTNSVYIYNGKINNNNIDNIEIPEKFIDISNKPKEMQNAVNILASKNIIFGITENLFAPDKTLTKSEAAAFVVRMLDYLGKIESPDDLTKDELDYFTDVTESDWFYREVYSAVKNNFITGASEALFIPNGEMSRWGIFEDIACAILTKYSGLALEEGENGLDYLKNFTDKHEFLFAATREKFMNDMGLAVKEGLVLRRIDGRLALDETMTRGDFAVMLYRLFEKIK